MISCVFKSDLKHCVDHASNHGMEPPLIEHFSVENFYQIIR